VPSNQVSISEAAANKYALWLVSLNINELTPYS